jgi:putative solute:sodium symporter small subunit
MERHTVSQQKDRQDYWKANLRLVALCLSIWFIVSYLLGIVLVDQLNAFSIGGYKLGFWFAQQGSIYVFVVLIFFYAYRMNKLDRQYHVQED